MRVLTGAEANRRARVLALFLVVAVPTVGWMVLLSVANGRVTIGPIAAVLFIAALANFIRVARNPRSYLDVDPEAGHVTRVEDGKPGQPVSLEAAGPVRATRRTETVRTKNGTTTITYHGFELAKFAGVYFYESRDELKARTRQEKLARTLKLGVRSLAGEDRTFDELDIPLFFRLRRDADARRAKPYAGSHLTVTDLMPGCEIRSNYRSWTPLVTAIAVFLVPFLFLGWIVFTGPGLQVALEPAIDNPLILAGIAVVLLAGIFGFYRMARDTFSPGVIRVTDAGVRYRGKRLRLEEIEEIDVTAGSPRLISDRGVMQISMHYCPVTDYAWLHHELRRNVIEAGQSISWTR